MPFIPSTSLPCYPVEVRELAGEHPDTAPTIARQYIARMMRNLHPWEKASPTRAQVAAASRGAFRGALVTVGGHHVAVHFNGVRAFIFTGFTADWN